MIDFLVGGVVFTFLWWRLRRLPYKFDIDTWINKIPYIGKDPLEE